jgi:tetratricopeptide (TPR) repeat protein
VPYSICNKSKRSKNRYNHEPQSRKKGIAYGKPQKSGKMRKTSLLLGAALGLASLAGAQETQITWGMVTNSIDKSDNAVQHEKRSLRPATWLEHERVYTRLFTYDLNGVMPGVSADNLLIMKMGAPAEKETAGNSEIWKWDRVNFYITDGAVSKWEYTAPYREEPLLVSLQALKKVEELDPDGKLNSRVKERAAELAIYLRIVGSFAYSDNNLDKSLKYFEAVLDLNRLKSVNTLDTTLINDCGVVAKLAGQKDKAIKYFLEAADLGYKSNVLYSEASKLYLESGDTASAISTLEKGIEKFNATSLITEMINIYLVTGKNQEALSYLEKAIAETPNNPAFYFAKGALNDELGKKDEAIQAYLKAIEIDEKYVDAYLNLGASYYNKGIGFFEKANEAKDNKSFEREKAKAEAEYRKALPYLEKVVEIGTEDPNTLKNAVYSLRGIYYRLEMYKEHKKMSDLYDTL